MAQIIKQSERIHHVEYEFSFQWADDPGSGFVFPCDEQGNIFMDQLQLPGLENLQKCLDGTYNVLPGKLEKLEWSYTEPAILKCDCGREVYLDNTLANSCECGREYSLFGQLLAPRSQWGEEWTVQPEEDYGLYPPYNPGE